MLTTTRPNINQKLLLLDSNIFVFAHQPEHPKHTIAVSLVRRGTEGKEPLAAAQQNLLEWYSVITSHRQKYAPLDPSQAARVLRNYQQSNLPIVQPVLRTWTLFLQLLTQQADSVGKDIFDMYLAATALSNGIGTILTDNTKDFTGIPGLTAVNPFLDEASLAR